MFLGQDNPVSQWIEPRRSSLLGLGGDMLSGFQNGTQGLQRGAMVDDANATRAKEEAQRLDIINRNAQWMRDQGRDDLAQLVEAGNMEEAFNMFSQSQQPGGGATMGLNPVWGTDAEGNPVLAQLSNQGGMNVVEQPEGFTFGKDPIRIDGGTHTVLLDPVTRQQIGAIPKENYDAAYDTAAGAAQGKNDTGYRDEAARMAASLPGLLDVAEELGKLGEKATYTMGGQAWDATMRELGQEPSEGALARTEYMAMVDNQVLPLLRETFGAAFTVQEGESLRATLGAPDKSPKEKQAVLDAFIKQKIRNLKAAQSLVPGASGAGVDGSGADPLGIR